MTISRIILMLAAAAALLATPVMADHLGINYPNQMNHDVFDGAETFIAAVPQQAKNQFQNRPLDWRGGEVHAFAADVGRINDIHQSIRLDAAECASACTMYLAVKHVCVAPGTAFGFHAATHDNGYGGESTYESYIVHASIPLYNHVVPWLVSPELHWLSGMELIDRFGFKECN